MPAFYHINHDLNLLFCSGSGELFEHDMLEQRGQIMADAMFHPQLNQLWDFRPFTHIHLGQEHLWKLSEKALLSAHSRRAFLVRDAQQFAVIRSYQSMLTRSDIQLSIFYQQEEALEWLGLPADLQLPIA